MASAIVVVSGLPRSGTSLMMQMLDRGGFPVVTDHVRAADPDNPRGYYEFEPVKAVRRDRSWLPATRGRAVKMVSQLLPFLPLDETYRVLFMERDLEEVLASQEKMLSRLGQVPAPREQIRQAYLAHLARVDAWLGAQAQVTTLRVPYPDLVARPRVQAGRVADFLGGRLDVEAMVLAVDPSLYRNRASGTVPAGPDHPGS